MWLGYLGGGREKHRRVVSKQRVMTYTMASSFFNRCLSNEFNSLCNYRKYGAEKHSSPIRTMLVNVTHMGGSYKCGAAETVIKTMMINAVRTE